MAGNQPLAGMRVAICRPEAGGNELGQVLVGLGAEVISAPLTECRLIPDGISALTHALSQIEHYQWVVATSANGVRALIAASGQYSSGRSNGPTIGTPKAETLSGGDEVGLRKYLGQIRVAGVGPATAAAFEQGGVDVDLMPSVATAAGLVGEFEPAPPDQVARAPGVNSTSRILAPLAELASQELEQGLRGKGWMVERINAYQMVPTDPSHGPAAHMVRGADVIIYSAPSIVEAYVERFGRPQPRQHVVCIGPKTATQARRHGLAPIVARTHTNAGMVAAVVALASSGGRLKPEM